MSYNRLTPVPLSSSILWDDCEAVLVTGTEVGSGEGVLCLCEVVIVSCWVVLIHHI